MDRINIERKPLRDTFKKTAKILREGARKKDFDPVIVESLMRQLEDKGARLSEIDSRFLEALLNDPTKDEKQYEEEFEASEKYRDTLTLCRTLVEDLLKPAPSSKSEEYRSAAASTKQGVSNPKRKFRLPEIELKKFGGDVKDWLSFWSQFQKIHEDTDIEPEDKFQYLIQSTVAGSRARILVESFPPSAANYPEAISTLKNRFARDELLVEVYVRELLCLVLNNVLNKNEKMKIATLYDRLESHLRALESIGVTSDNYAAMLYPLVESSLPDDVLRVWERSRSTVSIADVETDTDSTKSENRLKLLMKFLRNEVDGEERITLARTGFGLDSENRGKNQKKIKKFEMEDVPTAAGLFTGESKSAEKKTLACIFCGKGHLSQDCITAQKMSLEEKKKAVVSKRCCFVCLKTNHISKNCRTMLKCVVCGKKHFAIMCPELPTHKSTVKKVDEEQETLLCSQNVLASHSCSQEVLLQTLVVILRGNGVERPARVLIDTGSQRSYILKSTAVEMGYNPLGQVTIQQNLFGGSVTPAKIHNKYEIALKSRSGDYPCKFQVLDEKVICGSIPRVKKGPWMQELKQRKIILSDFGSSTLEIEILIGNDVAGKLNTGGIHHLKTGLVAIETRLGWTLGGKVPEELSDNSISQLVTSLLVKEADISDLWRLDTLGITDPSENQSKQEIHELTMKHFEETVKNDSEGRYEVCLPWIEGHPPLPTNKELAERRLLTTTKKLVAENRFKDYQLIFDDWMKEGIIEEVPSSELDMYGHYLPHRAVIKENSVTTKIRPVFDASAHMKNSPSLNDCLAKGPNLIELIPSVLIRFRMGKIGIISDIRRAFLQIRVKGEDSNFLRFLWWENYEEKKMKVYRHRRVVFGVSSSPFLLGATIAHHLEKAPVHLKKVAHKLAKSFYVDNSVTSVNSDEDRLEFMQHSIELMSTGKFDLTCWEHTMRSESSNSEDIVRSPVLGLTWNKEDDDLCCEFEDLPFPSEEPVTKRKILSCVHKIFDPIGFSCPITVIPKMLLQKAWELKVGWDEELPPDIVQKFKKWLKELPLLREVKVPRWFFGSSSPQRRLTLHMFSDASKDAYAACVFIRSETEDGVQVQLVMAKARVSPLKSKLTIPRLELLGCLIGARLVDFIKNILKLPNIRVYCWTDSSTALQWITAEDQWATFVWNRVQEIRSLTAIQSWHHVPGVCNPADLPSRGCTIKYLLEDRWWEGPDWLRCPVQDWPNINYVCDEKEVSAEKKISIVSAIAVKNEKVLPKWYVRYFSQYTRILRMIAWMLRFRHNANPKTEIEERIHGELSAIEINGAELKFLKLVQEESFNSKEDSKLKKLSPIEDKDGIIRIKTKISFREDSEDFKNPIVLPSDHPVVELLVLDLHNRNCHAGVQILLSIIRERFWILRGRRTLQRILTGCVCCKRYQVKNLKTEEVPLPKDRVKTAAVFEVIGIDLAGPLYLKGKQKSWIVLYTCAVYRAIHLELITSLSTEAFLQSFRRFVARRGRPSIVYTDNGTNFVGAFNAFKNLDWKSIEQYASVQRIIWRFNPPTAAWWGGWWERMVRSVKELLRRVLGKATLSYEELMTVLTDCEAVINSRPLTYLSEDGSDMVPLTPSLFLQDVKEVGIPEVDILDAVALNRRCKYRQKLRDDLRQRFRKEYLGMLVQQGNYGKKYQEACVGDIVLIGSDGIKRLNWILGKIIEVYPGKDGKIRVVRLKTAVGELVRPVQRIYPLEVTAKDEIVEKVDKSRIQKTGRADASKLFSPRIVTTRSGRVSQPPQRFESN